MCEVRSITRRPARAPGAGCDTSMVAHSTVPLERADYAASGNLGIESDGGGAGFFGVPLRVTIVGRRAEQAPTATEADMWRTVEDACSAILLLVMVAVGTLQILVRYVPSHLFDFFWTEELARLLLVWLIFWGATVVQRGGDHISMSVFADMLPAAWQRPLHLLSDAVIVGALAFLAWQGWMAAQLIVGQQTVWLGVTLAIFAYPVPICSALMIGYTLNGMWRRIRRRPLGSAPPQG